MTPSSLVGRWIVAAAAWLAPHQFDLPVAWAAPLVIAGTLYGTWPELLGLVDALTGRILLWRGGVDNWPYHPTSWPVWGNTLKILATLTMVGSIFLFVTFLSPISQSQWVHVVLVVIVGVPMLWLIMGLHNLLYYFGAMHTQISGEFRMRNEARPPVILLRSFDQDIFRRWYGTIYAELEWSLLFLQLGPFVAIGRPGAKYQPPGASKFYVKDSEWQQFVVELMKRSSLVVIKCGDTPGLGWELQQCFRLVTPQRIVIFVPSSPTTYESFARCLYAQTGLELPQWPSNIESCTKSDRFWFAENALFGMITFDRNCVPRFYCLVPRGRKILGRTFVSDRSVSKLGQRVMLALSHSWHDDIFDQQLQERLKDVESSILESGSETKIWFQAGSELAVRDARVRWEGW